MGEPRFITPTKKPIVTTKEEAVKLREAISGIKFICNPDNNSTVATVENPHIIVKKANPAHVRVL